MARPPNHWQSINVFSLLLWPVSIFFCFLASIRRAFYQYKLISSYRSPVPVIVVGNISVGGNGKTPLVIHLVETLRQKGFRPGVVSRGYGAQNPLLKDNQQVSVNTEKNVQLFGDEPWLIAKRTQAPVVIGANRSKAVEYLIKDYDCNIVISDDGMQHYAMQRDIEICVIDGQQLFGNRFCLPAGPLREKVSRLKSVDLLIFNGVDQKPSLNIDTPHSFMQLSFQQVHPLNNSEKTRPIESFVGLTVHAIAGIGNPERFFSQLKKYQIEVIEHSFDDHHDFNAEELCFSDNLPVVMTEKDAVKCRDFNLENVWYIPVTAELTDDIVERIIASI